MTEELRKKVEQRAYEIYLSRGGAPGDPGEDWARAEREVMAEQEKAQKKPAPVAVVTPPPAKPVAAPVVKPAAPKPAAATKPVAKVIKKGR